MAHERADGQGRLFDMPVPGLEKSREALFQGALRNLFSPVSQQTFDTVHTALESVAEGNYFRENASFALNALEKLYHASQTEGITVQSLGDQELGSLDRHVALVRSATLSLQRSGALQGNKPAAEATQAIEYMGNNGAHLLQQSARKEIARREEARSACPSR